MGLVLSMDINNKVINRFLCLCASAAVGAGGMYLYNKKHSSSSSGGGDYKLISECESVLKENGVDAYVLGAIKNAKEKVTIC